MKRYFGCIGIVVLCLSLLVGLIGCTESSEDTSITTLITTNETTSMSVADIDIVATSQKEFMAEYETELTANDVQDNITDNLGRRFFLDGYVELDDYYAYGFSTIDSTHFVLKLESGDYGTWYLYCDRKSFKNILDSVEKNNRIMLWAICDVPKENYEEGQDNMVRVYATRHYQ